MAEELMPVPCSVQHEEHPEYLEGSTHSVLSAPGRCDLGYPLFPGGFGIYLIVPHLLLLISPPTPLLSSQPNQPPHRHQERMINMRNDVSR